MPRTLHLRLVLIFNPQTTLHGKARMTTSSTSSVHARPIYIENSFIIVPGSSGYQFLEIGQAWNREAKKKAMVQRITIRPMVLVMIRNLLVGNRLRYKSKIDILMTETANI